MDWELMLGEITNELFSQWPQTGTQLSILHDFTQNSVIHSNKTWLKCSENRDFKLFEEIHFQPNWPHIHNVQNMQAFIFQFSFLQKSKAM